MKIHFICFVYFLIRFLSVFRFYPFPLVGVSHFVVYLFNFITCLIWNSIPKSLFLSIPTRIVSHPSNESISISFFVNFSFAHICTFVVLFSLRKNGGKRKRSEKTNKHSNSNSHSHSLRHNTSTFYTYSRREKLIAFVCGIVHIFFKKTKFCLIAFATP